MLKHNGYPEFTSYFDTLELTEMFFLIIFRLVCRFCCCGSVCLFLRLFAVFHIEIDGWHVSANEMFFFCFILMNNEKMNVVEIFVCFA